MLSDHQHSNAPLIHHPAGGADEASEMEQDSDADVVNDAQAGASRCLSEPSRMQFKPAICVQHISQRMCKHGPLGWCVQQCLPLEQNI